MRIKGRRKKNLWKNTKKIFLFKVRRESEVGKKSIFFHTFPVEPAVLDSADPAYEQQHHKLQAHTPQVWPEISKCANLATRVAVQKENLCTKKSSYYIMTRKKEILL